MTKEENARVEQVINIIKHFTEVDIPDSIETLKRNGEYVEDTLIYKGYKYLTRISVETIQIT